QVEERFRLHAERQVGSQDARQEFPARLDRSFCPAVLLRLERIHLHRDFGWRDESRHEYELPAAQLRAVAEIEILGQGVVLPPAGVGNRLAPPDPRGTVEVEEEARPIAPTVLEHEMRV